MSNEDMRLKLYSLSSNRPLAEKIANYLDIELGELEVNRFSDGEIAISIEESVRGDHVFILQSTSYPTNDNIMELLIMIDALRRASAKIITAVIPYYGYARQDRKAQPREPITAKLVANLLTTAGADRVVTLDLHASQIQGFFDIPTDHLLGAPLLASWFLDNELSGNDVVVVSPDHGGATRARKLAEFLDSPIAIVDKRRPKPNVSEVMSIIGDVKGKKAILVDDMIDTAGTIVNAAQALKDRGATEVYACATHGVFSPPAIERIKDSVIKTMVVTDSIYLPEEKRLDKIELISVSELIGQAIQRIYEERSVSPLFYKEFKNTQEYKFDED
ncbi:MAG TPA: ribose-phosphate diphosphokinase [Atopostipes sp.]|nr:ribose-phosphate diphosphokinase [Atopostipes sp.]